MARVEIGELVMVSSGTVPTLAGKWLLAASGATVQVNLRAGGAATVYAAATGATTLANPLTSDSHGRVEGWLDEGSYDLVVSVSGASYTQRFEAASGATLASVESSLYVSLAQSIAPYADVDLTGTNDTTAAVQSRLDNYNWVLLPPGKTIRCDTTLTIGSHRTFELGAHATVIRKTAASATTPVIRMNGANYSKLVGHGFVQSEKASPDGIIHVGPAVQTVETNVQRWKIKDVTVIGGSSATTNIGINLTSSEVAGPTGAGAGSNYLGTVTDVDIQQVGVGIKEGELCNAHNFNNVNFHLIGLASYQLAGGTAGVQENTHFGGFTHTKASGNITVIDCDRAMFCEFYGVKAEPDAPGVPGSKYYDLDANTSQCRIIGFGNFETTTQGVDAGTNNFILDENAMKFGGGFQVGEAPSAGLGSTFAEIRRADEAAADGYALASNAAGITLVNGATEVRCRVGGNEQFRLNAGGMGFYGTAPAAKPTVTGSRGGNAALASLLTALANLGLITDSTTA